MLFDKDTGKVIPQTPGQEKSFDIRMMASRDAKGNLRVNTSPPGLSGEPKEVYRGAGNSLDLSKNNPWVPVVAGDVYNLKTMGVSSGILGFKGG